MNLLISDYYRNLNARLHEGNERYGASGHKWSGRVRKYMRQTGCKTLLDYGCGKGTLSENLPEMASQKYDPSISEFSSLPSPADFVTCMDVLEHVEKELLDDVIAHVAGLTKKNALFAISLRPSDKELPDGRNAHLILKPAEWWRRRLETYFRVNVVKPRKGHSPSVEFAALCTPKPWWISRTRSRLSFILRRVSLSHFRRTPRATAG